MRHQTMKSDDTVTESADRAPQVLVEGRRRFLGSAALIGIGLFVVQLATPGALGGLPISLLLKDRLHASAQALATFGAVAGAPFYLKPLVGLFTDAFPLAGQRRRPYLLLAAGLGAILWLLLGLAPRRYGPLLAVSLALNLAAIVLGNTVGGLLVEVGQRSGATGRLGSLRILVTALGAVLASTAGGWLATRDLLWTGAVGGTLFALLFIVGSALLHEPPAPPQREGGAWGSIREQVETLRGARDLWIVLGCFALLTIAPGFATPLLYYQTNTLKFSPQFIGYLGAIGGIFAILGAGLYTLLCRRFRVLKLFPVLLLCHALGTLLFLSYRSAAMAVAIQALGGLVDAMAVVCGFDLASRAAPRRAATVGYALILSTVNLTGALSDVFGSWLFTRHHWAFTDLVWLNSATTLLALPVIRLLPASLTARREGEAPREDGESNR
jgi:MFS family permease